MAYSIQSKLLVAGFFSVCMATPSSAQAPSTDDLKAWFRSTHHVTRGFANTVSKWEAKRFTGFGSQWTPFKQAAPELQPLHERFVFGGSASMKFDGNDSLYEPTGGAGGGSYAKFTALRLNGYPAMGEWHLLSGTRHVVIDFGPPLVENEIKPAGHEFFLTPAGKFGARHEGGTAVLSSDVVPLGVIAVLGVVFDETAPQDQKLRLYLDGLDVTEPGPQPMDLTWSDSSLTIGGLTKRSIISGTPDTFLAESNARWETAEVLVYRRSLDAVEAGNLYADYLEPKYVSSGAPNVSYSKAPPGNAALLPRNTVLDTSAPLDISGVIDRTEGAVKLLVYHQDPDVLVQTTEDTDLSDGFDLSTMICTDLKDHRLLLQWDEGAVGSDPVDVAERVRVVAGDAYIVTGLSHSMAVNFYDEDVDKFLTNQRWIRSFGHTLWAIGPDLDGNWGLGQVHTPPSNTGPAFLAHAAVGSLGMRMADRIVGAAFGGVPIAVFNGGVNGSVMSVHFKTTDCLPFARPSTLGPGVPLPFYEALRARVERAGHLGKIRGIVWWCGEADAIQTGACCGLPVCLGSLLTCPSECSYPGLNEGADYEAGFDCLVNDWRSDYGDGCMEPPVFVVQGRADVGRFNSDEVRAAQLNVADSVENVFLTPSTGVFGFGINVLATDGLHFRIDAFDDVNMPSGYVQVGDSVADQVLTHVYGEGGLDVDAPRAICAYRDSANCVLPFACHGQGGNCIVIEFDREVTVSGDLAQIAADFRFNTPAVTEIFDDDGPSAALACSGALCDGTLEPTDLTVVVGPQTASTLLHLSVCGPLPTEVSYRGHLCDEGDLDTGWIRGNGGLGALSFRKLSIHP